MASENQAPSPQAADSTAAKSKIRRTLRDVGRIGAKAIPAEVAQTGNFEHVAFEWRTTGTVVERAAILYLLRREMAREAREQSRVVAIDRRAA